MSTDDKMYYYFKNKRNEIIHYDRKEDHDSKFQRKFYKVKKDYNKAITYQKEAIEIAKKFEAIDDIAISLVGLAQTYLKKGDTKLALQTFKDAEKTADETKAIYKLKEIYEGQAQAYARLHDYSNAYKYQYLLLGVKDTIYNIEGDKKLQGTQFIFEIEKKEGKINLLTKDAQIQQQEIQHQKLVRNSFVGGFAVVLFFAGIFSEVNIASNWSFYDEFFCRVINSCSIGSPLSRLSPRFQRQRGRLGFCRS